MFRSNSFGTQPPQTTNGHESSGKVDPSYTNRIVSVKERGGVDTDPKAMLESRSKLHFNDELDMYVSR